MDDEAAMAALLDAALPAAEAMVRRGGRVRPFGATLRPSGVDLVAADETDDGEVLAAVTRAFHEARSDEDCEAVGLFLEAVVRREGDGPRRALQGALEHRGGSAVDVFRPFEATDDGVVWGEPVRTPRGPSVFGNGPG